MTVVKFLEFGLIKHRSRDCSLVKCNCTLNYSFILLFFYEPLVKTGKKKRCSYTCSVSENILSTACIKKEPRTPPKLKALLHEAIIFATCNATPLPEKLQRATCSLQLVLPCCRHHCVASCRKNFLV